MNMHRKSIPQRVKKLRVDRQTSFVFSPPSGIPAVTIRRRQHVGPNTEPLKPPVYHGNSTEISNGGRVGGGEC